MEAIKAFTNIPWNRGCRRPYLKHSTSQGEAWSNRQHGQLFEASFKRICGSGSLTDIASENSNGLLSNGDRSNTMCFPRILLPASDCRREPTCTFGWFVEVRRRLVAQTAVSRSAFPLSEARMLRRKSPRKRHLRPTFPCTNKTRASATFQVSVTWRHFPPSCVPILSSLKETTTSIIKSTIGSATPRWFVCFASRIFEFHIWLTRRIELFFDVSPLSS